MISYAWSIFKLFHLTCIIFDGKNESRKQEKSQEINFELQQVKSKVIPSHREGFLIETIK